VRFEIVPGGHLGMLTGRAARGSTWRVLDEWVGQWSTQTAEPAAPAAPAATRSAPRKKSTASKTTVVNKGTTTRKSSAAPTTQASADAIGVNPTRRYGSAGSRSLAR
jgi:polyhydroxyalkanoate synthase